MNLRILIIVLLFSAVTFGQREAANWYFGTNAGLNFNNGDAVPLVDGALDTLEGCESFSDSDGNLLFYTEGVNVWNRNHEIMPNGVNLLGSFSATQSALVVPKPEDPDIYYIFTSDNVQSYLSGQGGVGFNYSVVDMRLNGGLGDVTTKNINLLPNASEKVTAVRNNAGTGFWVITHHRNKFYAYLVTAAGVNVTPVVSTIGPNITDFNNLRGAIKASPKGNKLVVAHTLFKPNFGGMLLLYDFNNSTGAITNELLLGDDLVFYGAEFSSDSTILYGSGKTINPNTGATINARIVQFDLDDPDVVGSRYLVADLSNTFIADLAGGMQIGINGKIYHSIPNVALSVINTPNNQGLNCDFRAFDVGLGGRQARFGLPPFIQSFFESIVNIENFCFGDATTFSVDSPDPIVSILWDFGDPASGPNNTSSLLNPTHVFSSTGIFTVTIDVEFANRAPQRFIEFVEISQTPTVNSNVSLVQCDIDGVNDGVTIFNLREAIPLLLDNPLGFTANFFETSADANNNENPLDPTAYQNSFDGQTLYVRVFKNSLCFTISSLTLEVEPMAFAGTTILSVCNTSSNPFLTVIELEDLEALLLPDYPGTEITFYETQEDALLEQNELIGVYENGPFNDPELYYRVEDDNACVSIGHIFLDVRQSPVIEDQDIVICPDDDEIDLDAGSGFLAYEWSTGETTQHITVSDAGVYTVTVFNGADCDATATITVSRIPAPDPVEIIVTDFSDNNTIEIIVPEPDMYQYSVYGPYAVQDNPLFTGLSVGVYLVQIFKDGCLVYEEEVVIGGPPPFFTPNGDGYHDTWQIESRGEFADAKIYIFDRYGKLLKQLSATGEGWDGTYRGNPMPSSDYWYRIELSDGRKVRGNFTLKR